MVVFEMTKIGEESLEIWQMSEGSDEIDDIVVDLKKLLKVSHEIVKVKYSLGNVSVEIELRKENVV